MCIRDSYRVEPDEQGVELLFGKWNNQTTQPGLHYFFPTPIGQTITPKVEVIRKINIGFRSASDLGFSSNTNAERKVKEESLMLTGDQNIIDIDYVVQWRIKNASDFLFNIRNPEATVKLASESAIREVVGQTTLEDALARKRTLVETTTRDVLQTNLNFFGLYFLFISIMFDISFLEMP